MLGGTREGHLWLVSSFRGWPRFSPMEVNCFSYDFFNAFFIKLDGVHIHCWFSESFVMSRR